MRYLPVSYDTKDKNLLILGGGLLALSKLNQILETDFNIYIISDSFVDEIKEISEKYKDKVKIKEEMIDENFKFFSYDYLLIATNNFELNSVFEKRAIHLNMLYERCDVMSSSNMLLNKVVEENDITIGISNYKTNPIILDIICNDIKNLLSKYKSDKIKVLNDIRKELIRKNSPNVDEIIKELYDKEKLTLNTYLQNLNSEDKVNEDEKEFIKNIVEDDDIEKSLKDKDYIDDIDKSSNSN